MFENVVSGYCGDVSQLLLAVLVAREADVLVADLGTNCTCEGGTYAVL